MLPPVIRWKELVRRSIFLGFFFFGFGRFGSFFGRFSLLGFFLLRFSGLFGFFSLLGFFYLFGQISGFGGAGLGNVGVENVGTLFVPVGQAFGGLNDADISLRLDFQTASASLALP